LAESFAYLLNGAFAGSSNYKNMNIEQIDINTVPWTYGILRPGEKPDMIINVGPLAPEKIREILGGDYEFIPIMRGEVLAALVDRDELPPNNHYQNNINGPVILGVMSGGGVFVGVLSAFFRR